ncbi:MAG: heavy metal translocating P-type ATPase [Pseudomonadota bacterium]|nr:heavy metal translocating P-type ATPase [Pseudomonadota bacterium]
MKPHSLPQPAWRPRPKAAAACCGGAAGHAHAPAAAPGPAPADATEARYRIDQMDCPTEEGLIRRRLEAMPGIVRLDFNLLDRELTVFHRLADTHAVVGALVELDMAPVALDGDLPAAPPPRVLSPQLLATLALGGLCAGGAEVLAWRGAAEASWPVIALALVSILSVGRPTLKKGWIALRHLTLNIFFLMSLAVGGALAIGKWSEAAMVVFLFAVAETIEALSLERARHAIKSLSALAPATAEVMQGDAWTDVAVTAVAIGSRIRVRAGARVPLDARVTCGRAALDQAPITGESMPVDKQPGDPLYAGSIVTDGVIEATTTAGAGDSTLARIAAAVQQAHAQRAPTQRMVDQFARYYTPTVVALALLTALLGPLLIGGGWSGWTYQALVLLVIACPCALVVSTPVTVVSALAAAARHGILVKGGAYLESGHLLKAVAFDKTGTLTHGAPSLTDAVVLGAMPVAQCLLIAASLDTHSAHPVAQALVRGWRSRQPDAALLPVQDFGVLGGRGVQASIDGQRWYLGNRRLIEELGMWSSGLGQRLVALEAAGSTSAILCAPSGPVAVFALTDTLRAESAAAIAALHALGIETVMLSGDNQAAASAIAARLSIDDARGNLLPEDKQGAVTELALRHGAVGMVGDGVNDAPALASASIGFAMGAAGTATALDSADVAIMDDDPRKIATFIALSKRTSRVLKQNIALALGIKVLFLGLALSGHATLWMAVFADMGASLLVVFNGVRLLRA